VTTTQNHNIRMEWKDKGSLHRHVEGMYQFLKKE